MKTQCGVCARQLCVSGRRMEAGFCPMEIHPDVFETAREIYSRDRETALMHKNAAIIEARGYIAWPRLKDIIEFSHEMGYRKLGLAFCPDLKLEALKTVSILEENGLQSASFACGLCDHPEQAAAMLAGRFQGTFIEALNDFGPDMIVNLGLCLAAEALTHKAGASPRTCFIARDPATFNNPAVSLYTSKAWLDWSNDFYKKKKPLKEKTRAGG